MQTTKIDALAVHSRNSNHLFAGGRTADGAMVLYITTDGGVNWLAKTLPASGTASAVAVHPSNELILYVAGVKDNEGVLYRTTDGGGTWTQSGAKVFTGYLTALALDPVSPFRIYAASTDGLYRSEDSGVTWTRCLETSTAAVAVDPAAPSHVYAGGWAGVSKSTDFGRSWTDTNRGLTVKAVNALEFVSSTGSLLASTQGGGIYQIRPGGFNFLMLGATSGGTIEPKAGLYRRTPGTRVTVSAAPDSNHSFLGWSGDASGTANPLTITVDRDLVVRAEFLRNLFAPLEFKGRKEENRSLLFVEYINILTWRPNPANDSAAPYRLYLVEGTTPRLVASLSSGVFEYRERGVDKDKTYIYRLVAVDPETNQDGPPATVTVK